MNVVFFGGNVFDYSISQTIEGFHLLSKHNDNSINFYCTQKDTSFGADVEDLEAINTKQALELSYDWADLIIFCTTGNSLSLDDNSRKVLSDSSLKHKKVFIDSGDRPTLQIKPFIFSVYFKREFVLPLFYDLPYDNIIPYSFSIYHWMEKEWSDEIDYSEEFDNRPIDVSFICFGGSNELRMACSDFLKKLEQDFSFFNFFIAVDEKTWPVQREEYLDILRKSKVSVSVPGLGVDCNRYWEIPGLGAVLASLELVNHRLLIRNNFEPLIDAIFFSNWGQMKNAILSIASDKDRWIKMRKNADLKRKQHTTSKRALQIIEDFKRYRNNH